MVFFQNIMTFNKCSIRGKSYGDVIDEITGEPVNAEDVSCSLQSPACSLALLVFI
jgi:hypothetical protein